MSEHSASGRRTFVRACAGNLAAVALGIGPGGAAAQRPGTAAVPAGMAPAGATPAGAAPGGTAPAAVVGATAPNLLIVLNSRDADVSLIDAATFAERGRIPTGKEPHHLYPTPDGASVIVADALSNDLLFLDPVTGQPQRRVRGIADPYQLGLSPDERWFVTAANRLDHVDVYRWADFAAPDARPQPAARLSMPKVPSHLVFTPDSRVVFVTLQESDELAAIDLATLAPMWKMPLGRQPAGLAISPDGALVFVGIMGQDYVDVIDWRARRSVRQVRTGLGAHAFRARGDRRHLFVSNRSANTISMLDMQSLAVVGEIRTPAGPDCIEVSADGNTLYTTARWARRLAVADVAQQRVVRTVAVGGSPHGVFTRLRAGPL